jgi:hypothetical protein
VNAAEMERHRTDMQSLQPVKTVVVNAQQPPPQAPGTDDHRVLPPLPATVEDIYILQYELQEAFKSQGIRGQDAIKKFAKNFWCNKLVGEDYIGERSNKHRLGALYNSRIKETVSKFDIQWKNNETQVKLPPDRLASLEKQARFLERLSEHDMVETQIEADGNCQFRALAGQLFDGDQERYAECRAAVIDQLKSNPARYRQFTTENWETYVSRMGNDTVWGDNITLQAAANAYKVTVHVYSYNQEISEFPIRIPSMHAVADDEAFRTISLSHIPETHYNSVRPSHDMSKDGAFTMPEDKADNNNDEDDEDMDIATELDVSMRDVDDDGKDGNDDDEDDDGEDEDNDDDNQVDLATPLSPEMGNKSAKRGTDMRPRMGDTPAAITAKKTQSRSVEAEGVTSIASFVDETSGKVKRRRSERRHRSKTDELQSNFFMLEGPNGVSHAMLPHKRGDAPTWHTYGFYFDSNGLPENPSFEQAFARVENTFPEGWYCAHDINADFVPPTR